MTPKEHLAMLRFWEKVDKSAGPNSCWPFMGTRVPKGGYGRVRFGSLMAAHRLAWILTHGDICSSEIDVCHSCDNPPCCNPAHLWIGTATDNMKDMRMKGRGTPRLTEQQVREIRIDERPKLTIASNYGISRSLVSLIKNRKAWKHL